VAKAVKAPLFTALHDLAENGRSREASWSARDVNRRFPDLRPILNHAQGLPAAPFAVA
jgi:hypothetical protein